MFFSSSSFYVGGGAAAAVAAAVVVVVVVVVAAIPNMCGATRGCLPGSPAAPQPLKVELSLKLENQVEPCARVLHTLPNAAEILEL